MCRRHKQNGEDRCALQVEALLSPMLREVSGQLLLGVGTFCLMRLARCSAVGAAQKNGITMDWGEIRQCSQCKSRVLVSD